MTKEGYGVVIANNGKEGLELAKQVQPDVIILDVLMPNMNGWSVLSSLTADEELAHIPVIMATSTENHRLAYSLGARDYLVKPIEGKKLKSLLQKYQSDGTNSLVMVVDDNSTNRDIITQILKHEQIKVIEADNGLTALNLLANNNPHLIILDLLMPEMDGFEFIANLRQHPQWHQIPVIVVTAKDLTQEELKLLELSREKILHNNQEYLTKNLESRIAELLNHSKISY